jgi:hypothetical protein
MSSESDGPSPKAPPTSTATAPRPGISAAVRPPQLHGPWPRPRGSNERWLGPVRPASTATSVALLIAAMIAALSTPLDRAGVGWLVTAVAGTIALIVARQIPYRPPASLPPPLVWRGGQTLTADRFGWSAATVALLGVGTVRAAGWLFLLCLATALVTGALAVAGGRSLRAMALVVGIAPIAGFRSLPWIIRGFGRIKQGPRVGATIAVSVALLAVFGALFASADPAFADVVEKLVPSVDGGTVARWIFVLVIAGGVLGGAAYLRAAPPDLSGMDGPGTRRVARLEWAIPLGLLVLLFAAFVTVQLTVLFGGSRHVLETDGLTYADYARSGFWQLLVVTGLTLAVVAAAVRWAPNETRTDRTLIRVVLGALATLTLVIVASALHRMNVYADTYGLTRLRLLVALCELWLGVVFLLVLIAGLRLRANWLARAIVGTGVLALLALATANPDGLIADRNIARYDRTHNIDTTYLANLSADAVPALDRLAADQRDCALNPISAELYGNPDDWRGWNYGRSHARAVLKKRAAPEQPSCDYFR